MRDLYNRLIEIPEGETITILRMVLEKMKLQVHCESETDVRAIVQALLDNVDLSKVKDGILLELRVSIDEKGVNVINYMDKSISRPSILKEIEKLQKNINEKFAGMASLLDQDPLFEETAFELIYKKSEGRYVYDSFVRPTTNINEHKALIQKLAGTSVFEEVTEMANNMFEDERIGFIRFKSDGVTLKDVEFGVLPTTE